MNIGNHDDGDDNLYMISKTTWHEGKSWTFWVAYFVFNVE